MRGAAAAKGKAKAKAKAKAGVPAGRVNVKRPKDVCPACWYRALGKPGGKAHWPDCDRPSLGDLAALL